MSYPVGTILRRPLGGWAGWLFFHWGVYVGEGLVIHYEGEGKKDWGTVVRLDSLSDFANGRPELVSVVQRPRSRQQGEAIRDRAYVEYRRGTANGFNGRYHFAFRNCQDFCNWCCAS